MCKFLHGKNQVRMLIPIRRKMLNMYIRIKNNKYMMIKKYNKDRYRAFSLLTTKIDLLLFANYRCLFGDDWTKWVGYLNLAHPNKKCL